MMGCFKDLTLPNDKNIQTEKVNLRNILNKINFKIDI